ncbi:hypothetical protein KR067_008627 [Drosophila pandora]|nr:hypothetical protein KR067_008627 [Drosophila pandora]
MGSKATKMEGEYLPDTPTLNKMRLASQRNENLEMTPTREQLNPLDPRSPNGCRTPLNFLQTEPRVQDFKDAHPVVQSENAFSQLRKRLLKGFSLNDPRSPQLNRTPLVLDEVRSLNMDDTFADLFVDTRAPSSRPEAPDTPSTPVDSAIADESCDSFGTPPMEHNNSSLEIVSLPYDEEETMPCEAKLQTPPPQQLHVDPRSPSVGVDRTPIIFCDDEEEEAREAQMLEQILETLTLNLSTDSSMASFACPPKEPISEESFLPSNKHLERVRLEHKRRIPPQKPARANKPKIFVDQESQVYSGASIAKSSNTPLSAQKRTPLSCVKNREHLRSQSTEKDLRQTPLVQQNGQVNKMALHGRRLITGDALNG